MKIGIKDSSYTGRYGYKDGILRLKRHGYNTVDFQGFINTDGPLWKLPEKDFEAGLKETKEFLDEQGIEIFQTHAPWGWPPKNGTADERRALFENMHKALRGTKLLGAKYFVVHPLLPFENEPGQDADAVWGINQGFIGAVADYARFYGITVCLENLPFKNLCISTPMQVLDFVEEMNHQNLKVCLDTGHCAVFGLQPSAAVRLLGAEWLRCMHVHDNDGQRDSHWLPKRGIIDWEDYRNALQEIGFQGSFSLECSVPEEFTGKERDAKEQELCRLAAQLAGNE